jgi:hypothetical protein
MRYIALLFALLMVGCRTTKQTIITPKEHEIKVFKDSVVLRDSIVLIPIEKETDISKITDTLTLETSLAIAKSWIDDSQLRGTILNKKQHQKRVTTLTKYVEVRDTIIRYVPQPYEVVKEVRHVPKIYKYALIILCLILGFYGFKFYKKFIL